MALPRIIVGRSPHGERGLKYRNVETNIRASRRSPHGERGLKYVVTGLHEIIPTGRSPHGERGLKSMASQPWSRWNVRRSPHGERGLKYRRRIHRHHHRRTSLSSWRAWIEICGAVIWALLPARSLSSWRAWIEIFFHTAQCAGLNSRSPHGERGLKWLNPKRVD